VQQGPKLVGTGAVSVAGHDIILLGERGQAKTRLIRHLVELLDDEIPVIEGCEVNDHPYHPICARCRALVAELGPETPVDWIGRDTRYAEKLATPDTSVADLIGDVDPIRARVGINGLVTSSFAFLGMVGWGSSLYKGPGAQQFDSLIAQAELKWYIAPNPGNDPVSATLSLSSLALGYTRDFFNSYLGDFYARDRGYATLSHFFGGRFLLVIDGGVAAIRYPDIRAPQAVKAFTAIYVDPSLFVEYRLSDSFGLNSTLRYTSNITEQVIAGDALKWSRFEGFIGVRWFI